VRAIGQTVVTNADEQMVAWTGHLVISAAHWVAVRGQVVGVLGHCVNKDVCGQIVTVMGHCVGLLPVGQEVGRKGHAVATVGHAVDCLGH
jgi:hypothetical protein